MLIRKVSENYYSPVLVLVLVLIISVHSVSGQGTRMLGMENSVGYLSSGTSLEPKTTSESAAMFHKSVGNWVFMFHANAFLVDTQQSGPRGRDKLFSSNWVMPMFARESGRHSIIFRPMVSFEPATVTKRRYPELFQAGETAYGLPITDGQHPHDLFMELAARYEFRVSEGTHLFLYGGPIGEAALGPPAFPHDDSKAVQRITKNRRVYFGGRIFGPPLGLFEHPV